MKLVLLKNDHWSRKKDVKYEFPELVMNKEMRKITLMLREEGLLYRFVTPTEADRLDDVKELFPDYFIAIRKLMNTVIANFYKGGRTDELDKFEEFLKQNGCEIFDDTSMKGRFLSRLQSFLIRAKIKNLLNI
ncbi:MAG: hypothetical protein WC755_07405 [Candidatus Woesearchaeota archaeon]|jgi:hypothetical protein